MASSKKSVKLVKIKSTGRYRVATAVNTLKPAVGEFLNESEVQILIALAESEGWAVTISEAKSRGL